MLTEQKFGQNSSIKIQTFVVKWYKFSFFPSSPWHSYSRSLLTFYLICEYLVNSEWYDKCYYCYKWRRTIMPFRFQYIHLTLAHSKGQISRSCTFWLQISHKMWHIRQTLLQISNDKYCAIANLFYKWQHFSSFWKITGILWQISIHFNHVNLDIRAYCTGRW